MSLSSRGSIKVVLEGRGTVTLRPSDHIATGGEGSIYRVSDSVVKVYSDPDKMRANGTPEKLKLLSALSHPYVVSPQGMALSERSEALGYYMPFVTGEPLSRVFTNEFWTRNGFTVGKSSVLVNRMRDAFEFAHQHKAVLVDPNELNWLVIGMDNPEPRVVDVDSWSIGRWPASVIMPSIRDWNASTFDERSDWFAWAVVTFQIYTGVHPYKGTLDGFERSDLVGRMKANASVFSAGARLNRAVHELSAIPSSLCGWYEATFQKGERSVPPSPFDTGKVAKVAVTLRTVATSASGSLVFDRLLSDTPRPVVRVFPCGVALRSNGDLVDVATGVSIGCIGQSDCEAIKVRDGWLVACVRNGDVVLKHVHGTLSADVPFHLSGAGLLRYQNRIFVITETGLTELSITVLPQRLIASAGQTWGIINNSMKWFQGFGILDSTGAKFLIIPFGEKSATSLRVKELDGTQIVSGISGPRFVSLIGMDATGQYSKIELTMDADYQRYAIWRGPADGPELNMAILPKGVCATIVRDGELGIFVPSNGKISRVNDRQITTDALLSNVGDTVVYTQNGTLWSIKMR